MAKRLADIASSIQKSEQPFQCFLQEVLDESVRELVAELQDFDDLYLFSGIIRDYFLGNRNIRDVDLVIDSEKDLAPLLSKYQYRRNSFGGFKIQVNNISIDLWYLKDTWALKNNPQVIDLELIKYIPNTSFFNFSSILYSFSNNSFIYTKAFLRFLRDKKIDYVFKPNASYALCVVNSLYYNDKLHLSLTNRLLNYLAELNKDFQCDYEQVQIKHFGRILYDNAVIYARIQAMLLAGRQQLVPKRLTRKKSTDKSLGLKYP